VEKVGDNAFQEFKASQSYIDSCVDYYGTGFDDCLKQVVLAFPELNLFGITMEEFVLTTPASNTVTDESDDPKMIASFWLNLLQLLLLRIKKTEFPLMPLPLSPILILFNLWKMYLSAPFFLGFYL